MTPDARTRLGWGLLVVGVVGAIVLIVTTLLPWPFAPINELCLRDGDLLQSFSPAEVLSVFGKLTPFPLGVECTYTLTSGEVTTVAVGWGRTIAVGLALATSIIGIVLLASRDNSPVKDDATPA